ncbi:PAS domain-containing protein [Francisella philomiragia]|uniref:PAS domain-containing protein n=1 Tax=Francisella philomiragia TaxID=28110 RepID=UPI001904FF0A|nr:PAS domain-containing protein [Francisella philomiragia]MBK2026065.1 PAS domain-containing protein [Francisella philomiragia]
MYNYLLKSIFSPIFQGIANINRDGLFLYVKNIDSKYIFLSKNICNLSKIEYDDAIGKCDDDFNWGKEQADAFRSDDLYVFTTKKSHTSEYLLSINGGFLWIETEKIPIMTENNEVIGILGIAQDVTYRKTLISSQYKKNNSSTSQRDKTSIVESFREYLKDNDDVQQNKNQVEQLFIRNSLIEQLYNQLIKQSKFSINDFVSLNKELTKVFSQLISKELIIISATEEIETKYYNYLVICLYTMELLKNKTFSEKILINIDKNEIKIMINRAGEKHKINMANTKFLTNYITSDIMNVLDLKLDIFVINDSFLPVAITITLSDKDTIY